MGRASGIRARPYPRWTFSLYWRRDGLPIWRTAGPDRRGRRRHRPAGQAETLLQGIATELGVEADMVTPAFEDPAEWIIKEGDLPANVTPQNSEAEGP